MRYPNMISSKDLKEKFEMHHSVPYTDRDSLSQLDCLRTYFPNVQLISLTSPIKRLEFKEAKRRIREAIRLCESDPDYLVGRFWRPYEWRICQPTDDDLKWMIVKRCWSMIRGWQKKEGYYKSNYGITITEKDLIQFEKELDSQNTR